MQWEFWKLHGLGNDYLYFDVRGQNDAIVDWPKLARRMCDRHFGVGADGIITIASSNRADARMIIYNADGSRSEMCGNGLRGLAKWLYDREQAGRQQVIETDAGLLFPEVLDTRDGKATQIRVNMGPVRFAAQASGLKNGGSEPFMNEWIDVGETRVQVCLASMGNPHLIVFGPLWDVATMAERGPQLEHHLWFPQRINVHSVEVIDAKHLRMRHWERGAGLTMACGTGVAAAGATAAYLQLVNMPIAVSVPGGELLVDWKGSGDDPVFLTGPAEEVFSGRFDWAE
ncbi:MAG: diaminopimelate epimerase [Sulfobacillus acidophilus]|uniref:Diaminopimelate epimerase n=1 Tax=Sulfobacillus acidophilus TaxID=53633 RepID=A0A2T2WEX8_9FIRM|nr:MAG: diaminopimelate epimerase [Sulfobacillus acidophilus]